MAKKTRFREQGVSRLSDLQQTPGFKKWYDAQRPKVQQAVQDYPLSSPFQVDGVTFWVFAWIDEHADEVGLLLTRVNPETNLAEAKLAKNMMPICLHCFAATQKTAPRMT
jgi:hypothetical protein